MNKGRQKIIEFIGSTDTIAELFASWFIVGGILLFSHDKSDLSLNMFDNLSPLIFVAAFLSAFVLLSALRIIFSKFAVTQISLGVSALILIVAVMSKSNSYFMIIALSLLTFLVLWYLAHSEKLFPDSPPIAIKTFMLCLILVPITFTMRYMIQAKLTSFKTIIILAVLLILILGSLIFIFKSGKLHIVKPSKVVLIIIISVFVLAATFIVGYIVAIRYISYSTTTYDFGIFTNMYYHLKTDFLPYVSCERDKLLSHFSVHFSPALYLLLPAYLIFPSPVTIQVAQVVLIYSGIIPLVLIMKNYKLDSLTTLFIAIAYSAYPIFGTGCYYDFHENCFLIPFLLWMFCLYEYDKTILTFVSALLVLSVKEDAFIYILVFAVYLIFSRKDYKRASVLIALAVIYFGLAYLYLSGKGEGIMSYRYANLTGKGESLFKVIQTVAMNPGYFLSQLFSTTSSDFKKVEYLLKLILPLAFIPFISKKFSRFILLAPILLNLITMYKYQYDITFQYSFGISAFLFYVVILNLAERKESTRHLLSCISALTSIMFFVILIAPPFVSQIKLYNNNKDVYKQLDAILEEVPEDASVTASRYLTVKLSNRDEIYDLHYHKDNLTDYIVLDMRENARETSLELFKQYKDNGYVLVSHHDGLADIYKK